MLVDVMFQESLLLALTKHVDSHSSDTDSFVVKTTGTAISKNMLHKVG